MVLTDILQAVDRFDRPVIAARRPILLDLSAAFDTVDHPIERLQTTFGIGDSVYRWVHFQSYQYVRHFNYLICGVPQGSMFGP